MKANVFRFFIVTNLISLFTLTANAENASGCEARIHKIASDMNGWIQKGGPAFMKFPSEIRRDTYVMQVPAQIESVRIKCVGPGEVGFPVQENGEARGCVAESTGTSKTLKCDREIFVNGKVSSQYSVIHHIYAQFAGLESSKADPSSYVLSRQLPGFLSTKGIPLLEVRRAQDKNGFPKELSAYDIAMLLNQSLEKVKASQESYYKWNKGEFFVYPDGTKESKVAKFKRCDFHADYNESEKSASIRLRESKTEQTQIKIFAMELNEVKYFEKSGKPMRVDYVAVPPESGFAVGARQKVAFLSVNASDYRFEEIQIAEMELKSTYDVLTQKHTAFWGPPSKGGVNLKCSQLNW